MNKSFLALAVLTFAATAAIAQSSVTVYGKVVRNNERGHGQVLLEAEQLMPVVITLAKR